MKSLFLLLLLSLLLPSYITSWEKCDNYAGNYTAGSTYAGNVRNLLTSIAANYGSYNWSSGQAPDQVNAIWLCRGDYSPNECRECMIRMTSEIIEGCPNQKQVYAWDYRYCMIRFLNEPISGILETFPTYYSSSRGNVSDPKPFEEAMERLFTRIRVTASRSTERFATGTQNRDNFRKIYGLMQCTRDLSSDLCDRCLSVMVSNIPNCCLGRLSGVVTSPSCLLLYGTAPFYTETEAPTPTTSPSPPLNSSSQVPKIGGTKNTSRIRIIAIVVPIVGASVLCFLSFFFFLCRRNLTRSKIENKRSIPNDMTVDEISHEGPPQFDFDMIRAATDGFANGKKLGEGGFGAVYKGTLSNGQDIAVKRLDKDSRQGDLEFKNEVKLVAKLQHRNLVRLLGFCLQGRERLLIYEFVPNASLDQFLFRKRDATTRMHLDWARRSKIIQGIARGLLYLHEDSRLRIIHRDLKTSNILLDADMNPKIADFGMARWFNMDEAEGSTNRIVGTYGYMAPEYAMHGEFSVKSDVFSFGVVLLEIVTGQKNNLLRHESSKGDLLSNVWRNWKSGMHSNVIDPSLGSVSGNEIARCIHIGLLCVQDNVNNRPTMASVHLMLTSSLLSLQLPLKPAFFMHTDAEISSQGTNHVALAENDQSSGQSVVWSEASVTDSHPR